MIRYLAFLFITLASVGFYNYHAIFTPNAEKLLFYISVLAGAFVAAVYGYDTDRYRYPRRAYAGLIASMVMSSLVCGEFHMQSFPVTFKASLAMILGYSCFYIFMRLQVSSAKVIQTYLVLCAVSTVVFFCNMLTMPNNIFGQPVIDQDFSRGILRVQIVFIELFPLLVFYAINKYLETKEKKWIVVIAWLGIMIFLSVVRQVIAATAILGFWFYFRKISLAKKMAAIVMVIFVVAVVLPQIPVYKTLIELSEDQKEDNEQDENIRVKAWRYYTYENQENPVTVLFGNGVPSMGNSTWGVQFDSDTEVTGCYAADVGWAGFFYYFGLAGTLCLLIVFISAIRKKKSSDNQYINYWLIYICLTSVTSGPILFYFQITQISLVLYLAFTCESESERKIAGTEEPYKISVDNTQHRKYPQLR